MGVIREYQQQTRSIGAVDGPAYSADMFGAQEGRAAEKLGTAVQGVAETVGKRLDQENTSDITQKVTKAQADLAIKLRDTIRTAEPGDKKVFEAYNQEVEDTLGKIGEEANTVSARAFYGEASTRIKGQLAQTAADGQADLAGVKAVTDYTQTQNNLTATTLANPNTVDLQRQIHKQAIENLVATGQLPREKAIQLERQGEEALAVAAVRGWADLNPEHARKKLKSGEFNDRLGADGVAKLEGEIDQAIRAKEVDAERRRIQQERVVKQQQQQTQNDFLEAMVEGKLDTKMILQSNLEAFGSGSKEQFIQMMKASNERKLETNPAVLTSLFERIHLPDSDPNKIIDEAELNQEVIKGNLSLTDLNRLRDEVQGSQTAQGKIEADLKKQVFEMAKSKLTKTNPLTGFRDPDGDEAMAKFMVLYQEEYKAGRAKGIPATELNNPNSEHYLGKYADGFMRTNKQIQQSLLKRARGGPSTRPVDIFSTQPADAATYKAPPKPEVPKKLPGETPAAFLKRVKGGG